MIVVLIAPTYHRFEHAEDLHCTEVSLSCLWKWPLFWVGTVLRYELCVEWARCRLTYSLSSWGQRSMVWVLGFLLFLKIMLNLILSQCVKESTKQKGQERKCQVGNTLESSWVAFSVLGCEPVAIFPSFFIMLWFGPKTMPFGNRLSQQAQIPQWLPLWDPP